MAEKVLFTVTKPPSEAKTKFSGRKETHPNSKFDGKNYQVAFMFKDDSEGIVNVNNDITDIKQHPIVLWKSLDIDTPFFKECLNRKLIIGEMSFHFFHSRGKDKHPMNHFTIILKGVKVIQSQIIHFDISEPHDPEQGAFNKNLSRPYIEQLKLTAADITWKYKRDSAPRKETKSTQFKIGGPVEDDE